MKNKENEPRVSIYETLLSFFSSLTQVRLATTLPTMDCIEQQVFFCYIFVFILIHLMHFLVICMR